MKLILALFTVVCLAVLLGAGWEGGASAGCSDAKFFEAEKCYQEALKSNSPEEKIRLFEMAFKTCPDHGNHARGYYMLGRLYYDRNEKGKAFQWLLQANRFRAPLIAASIEDLAQTNLLLGNLYQEKGRTEQALIHMNIYRSLSRHRNKQLEQNLITNAENFLSVIYSPEAVKQTLTVDKTIARADRAKVNRLEVYFDFAEAVLDEDARKRLDSLGRGLQNQEFAGCTMTVEGHTDESGGNRLNCNLGLRRAEAVKEYLEKQCGIKNIRLELVTYGKSFPAIPREGNSTDQWPTVDRFNRRVVIWNDGSPGPGEKDIKVEALAPKSPCSEGAN